MVNKEAEEILRKGGVSPTPNRILVVRELAAANCPLSLAELEQRLDTLDKSSVFRVLTLLASRDLVHALEDGRGIAKYELCQADHSDDFAGDDDLHCHFYCTECRRTFCLPDLKVPDLKVPEGFNVRGANFMLKGICPDCG
ncbi:MAG: transcriptional repressor [Muribaculaceae bacterium]|nr:transcriptional repressor [Muribaculaceae bacterium]